MECNKAITHEGNALTTYKNGCRGDACRMANAAHSKAWRRKAWKSADRAGSAAGIVFVDGTVGPTEWAAMRGYDPATRTYR